MKIKYINFLFILIQIGLILSIASGCRSKQDRSLDPGQFAHPPENNKIYAWWHWMDENITREGITKDLEAMKSQGITGVTILNVGLLGNADMGVLKVPFASPEWFNMFQWALHEANRLGMVVGAHNCDGWSTSGGPWISPDKSMKEFTWNKTLLTGGRSVDTLLTKPFHQLGYYKDIAVVAYPVHEKLNSYHLARPEVRVNNHLAEDILMDGNPLSFENINQEVTVEIRFKELFEASKLAVHLRVGFSWTSLKNVSTKIQVQSSMDGYHFYPVVNINVAGVNENRIAGMPRIKSKYFRVVIQSPRTENGDVPAGIAELELLNTNEKPLYNPSLYHHVEKVAITRYDDIRMIFSSNPAENNAPAINPADLLDITNKMDSSGRLHWRAPEGNWTILRFGFTTTGATNGPATEKGRGLECDKMDTMALNIHYRNFPEKLIRESGQFKGKTFQYLFIDSWECGFQNWTSGFEKEFEKRRGYNIISWIPALCGEIVKNGDQSEVFLNDFRRTIGDLIGERYYNHFADLCHRDGMRLHAEVIYGGPLYPPLDILKSNSVIDVPMFEFWAGFNSSNSLVSYDPVKRSDFDKPAFAALAYQKPIVASEAYTGYAHYSESPWDLKLFGDRGYCAGINRMVLHSYVHQPFEKVPGLTLGIFASHFNRHNSWWPEASGWFTYQARIQYILQKGTPSADILFYVGDRSPEFGNYNEFYELPAGYNAAQCNADLLKTAEVKNGNIVLSNGQSYQLLILPQDSAMELSTLYKIGGLVIQGASVYGPAPDKTLSLNDFDENNTKLRLEASKIWGNIDGKTIFENDYGQGRVYWGKPLANLLTDLHFIPDFESSGPGNENLLYFHKKLGATDIYFVVNQTDKPLISALRFRVQAKSPQIWDPEYGTVYPVALYKISDHQIEIPVKFNPRESLFFIFNGPPGFHLESAMQGGETVFPLPDKSEPGMYYPRIFFSGKNILVNAGVKSGMVFTNGKGRKYELETFPGSEYSLNKFEGKISFFNRSYMPAPKEIEISQWGSWTLFQDPEIQYFSGIAEYTINFDLPPEMISSTDSLLLTLGTFKETAEVSLNDSLLGDIWSPDQYLNIKGLAHEKNVLKVKVANVYRNRIIGDLIQFGKVQHLWTTSPVDEFLSRNMPLRNRASSGRLK